MVWTPPTASSPVYLHAYLDGAGLVSDPQGPLFRHHSHNRQRLSPAIGSLGNYILRLFDRQLSSAPPWSRDPDWLVEVYLLIYRHAQLFV
jgi:hypothetical protein